MISTAAENSPGVKVAQQSRSDGLRSDLSPFPDGHAARILIVDDEPINVKVVRKHLASAGYRDCTWTLDSAEVLSLVVRSKPDVILLDIVMPDADGLELLAKVRELQGLEQLPVVMLTAVEDRATKQRAFELGATDFLAKPVDHSELVSRVRNVILAKAHHDHLQCQTARLQQMVELRTAQLETANRNLINCLARAAELRDDDTGKHVLRVSCYCGIIARGLGWSESMVAMLESAAQLHDVGKLGVPDVILRKEGRLTPEEFELMQKHSGIGRKIFECVAPEDWLLSKHHAELGGRMLGGLGSDVLNLASQVALTHHERWDGSGYPIGLAGTDIPIAGRITAVADVFDALTTKRVYKPAYPLDKAFSIMEEGRAKHFDPDVLDCFFSARQEVIATQLLHADA